MAQDTRPPASYPEALLNGFSTEQARKVAACTAGFGQSSRRLADRHVNVKYGSSTMQSLSEGYLAQLLLPINMLPLFLQLSIRP